MPKILFNSLTNDSNSSILNRHKITKMNSLIDAKMVTPL